MGRDKGVSTGHRGVHRVGKHTKAGQAAAKAQPRIAKGSASKASDTTIIYTGKPKGLLGRLFGK